MSRGPLVAGIGNIFFGDDGFGVAVARRLYNARLPPGSEVADFGIRALHLAFDLLSPPSLLVLVDAVARGGAPGTLYVIDPELEDLCQTRGPTDAHGMDLPMVFDTVKDLGGTLPTTRIVGCEPETVTEGMRLSRAVQRAVEPAARIVHSLLCDTVKPA